MKLLLWVWIVFLFFGCKENQKEGSEIEKGILNFAKSEISASQELKGDWLIIKKQAIRTIEELPAQDGEYVDTKDYSRSTQSTLDLEQATFYVEISSADQIKNPALYIPALGGCINVFVNDQLIYSNTRDNSQSPIRSEIVNFPKSENGVYHVFLQTNPSVISKNLIHTYLRFGEHKTLQDEYGQKTLIKIFIAASFIILGIFLLTMFSVIPKIKSLLYFAVFSLLIAMRLLVTGDILINYWVDFSWETLFKLEYLSFYGSALFTALFMQDLFKKDIKIHFFKIYVIVMSLFIGVVILTNPGVFLHTSIPFQVFLISISIHPIYQIVKIALKGNYVARIFLIGFLIFYMTVINDILLLNNMIESVQLFHYGTLFLILAMSFLLPMYFTKLYKESNQLNKKVTQQNNELNKVNTDLERFVYSVTHDLKAPLASLEGLINIARIESKDQKLVPLFVKQEESVAKLKTFIEEILTLSRNSKTEIRHELIDLEPMIHDTVNGFSYLKNSDRIEKNISVKQHVEFMGDPFRMKTILRNLISNSIKYSDFEKPHPFFKIELEVDKNSLKLNVIDNGLGIAEDHQKKLFNMFFRAHGNDIEGTGLGLYIVKECLDLLEGKIKITSIEKIGTTVSVSIPNYKYQPFPPTSREKDNESNFSEAMKALGIKTPKSLGAKILKKVQ